MIEFDDQRAVFKAEVSVDEKLLSSGYGMRKATDRSYFEKAQATGIESNRLQHTPRIDRPVRARNHDMLELAETSTAAIPADTEETEHDIDLIDLADQTRLIIKHRCRTKPASEKQISIVTDRADAKTIRRYFGKNAHNLTDGEANLAIKTIFGDIDWKDVERISSM